MPYIKDIYLKATFFLIKKSIFIWGGHTVLYALALFLSQRKKAFYDNNIRESANL